MHVCLYLCVNARMRVCIFVYKNTNTAHFDGLFYITTNVFLFSSLWLMTKICVENDMMMIMTRTHK